jgi:hypothetical protein
MTAPKDTSKDTNAADKDAAKGTAGSGGADQAGAEHATKDNSGSGTVAKDVTLHGDAGDKGGEAGARRGAGAKTTIVDRSQEVRLNRTDREAQIERANAHMKSASNPKSDAAKTLSQAHKDEEAIYEKLKDAPPATGKAFNTVTPTRVDGDGTRHW